MKYKRIFLPKGGITMVAKHFGIHRDTCSRYLRGNFDEFSPNYTLALRVREFAKTI